MYIRRLGETYLKEWRGRENRKPLIIRGARQTGKSWLVKQFGTENFKHLVIINFEKEPQFKTFFERTSDIKKLVSEIELVKNVPIVPGKTLLFIDEIQQCPSAITKLRYFHEELPELHTIAAGSLLEFVLENELVSFPVGRVEFYYLFPICFAEFLGGCGEHKLIEYLEDVGLDKKIEPLIHLKLRELLKEYLLVGGMPEATAEFLKSKRYKDCEKIWESIIQTYREDFKKYSKRVNVDNVEFAFNEAPHIVGQQINLTKFGKGAVRAREVKTSLKLLERAMLIYNAHQLKHMSFPLVPLQDKRSKLLFLDVGLVQYMNHISKEILESQNYSSVYRGGLAEQLVGQELLPLTGSLRHPELYYWRKDKREGTAEVDYLYPSDDDIFPVEVKSGKGGSLFSLHQFMYEYGQDPVLLGHEANPENLRNINKKFAIRIYDGELNLETIRVKLPQLKQIEYSLLSVPLYLIHKLPDLCKEGLRLLSPPL
ncbi:MAG: ATP-binding protein [Deltaproteobacteria bacterium]|nr:ATP-binding protein [Deltaproteobacteria bacterium]